MKEPFSKAYEILDKVFGFEEFLPGQKTVLADILASKNVVAIMPTGAGKSLLYQLPALLYQGLVLVISPLISLMQDQVQALQRKGVRTAFLNSTLSHREKDRVVQNMQRGGYQVLYITPERLQNPFFREALRQTNISMIAVDEAHCISQWGYDFRPDYLKIKDLLEYLQFPQTIALTATATLEVREEIAQKLGLSEWADHVAGFDRNNLHFAVIPVRSQKEKIEQIADIFRTHGESGIVYANTRKNVEWIQSKLQKRNVFAGIYHGGMSDEERVKTQNEFMQGHTPMVIATNAFGMGIDKANIRFVVHFDIPSCIEAYYQEIGRAGRDGDSSYCCLLFNYADTRVPRFFIEQAYPPPEFVLQAWQKLRQNPTVPPACELMQILNLKDETSARYLIALLERANLIARAQIGGYICIPTPEKENSLYQYLQMEQMRKQKDEDRLQQMVRYAYHRGCRRTWILDYFGDHTPHHNCKNCDNCNQKSTQQEITGKQLIEILKALSAVARLSGRLGKTSIAKVLTGSKDKVVMDMQLTQLPTYGALAYRSQLQVCDLLEKLIAVGYIVVRLKEGKYPLLHLTKLGNEVMMQRTPCYLPQEELISPGKSKPKKKKSKANIAENVDQGLYEKLCELRREIARKLGVSAFIIFPNSTLEQMALEKPATLDKMSQIKGVGKKRLIKYGEKFLKIILEN